MDVYYVWMFCLLYCCVYVVVDVIECVGVGE